MSSFNEQFAKAEEYLRVGNHSNAYRCLETLVYSLTSAQLANLEDDLKKIAGRFQRKRETNLLSLIEETRNQLASGRGSSVYATALTFRTQLREKLVILSNNNIFDWSTSYKKCIAELFDSATLDWRDRFTRENLMEIVREEICNHSKEIFEKGYKFKSDTFSEQSKQNLAARGLVSFLDLPFQQNLERLSITKLAIAAEIIRQLCSTITTGIIEGFSNCSLGSEKGAAVLQQIDTWRSYIGLLTATHLKKLEPVLGYSGGLQRAREYLMPLCESLDQLLANVENDFFFIRSISWDARVQSLTVELVFPIIIGATRSIRTVTYLNSGLLSFGELEQQLNRDAAVILAPLSELMIPLVDQHPVLRERVVNTSNTATSQSTEQAAQIASILRSYTSNIVDGGNSVAIVLRFNYAEEFPLEQARVPPRFYVDRPSVRKLLPSINSRSGIRLWTSIRRSGKTTSCVRLARDSDAEDVVFQTCQFTDQEEYSNFFFNRVMESLLAECLPNDFLSAFFQQYAAIRKSSLKNIVLVIDEYETLFEFLELKSQSNRLLQIGVVQPLLNQLAEFAQSNLLVLLGQRPDAHFILMEQNQFSPLVRHEAFPLFDHAPSSQTSEFCDLLQKTLTFHVPFDLSFANKVFAETQGHPYLTVSMLRDLLAYLISEENWTSSSTLSAIDFERYAPHGFSESHLRRSKYYMFFRKMVAGYLASNTMRSQPWLFAVHDMMNVLARTNVEMTCSEFEFGTIFESRGLSGLGLNPNDLMDNAINGNFLAMQDGFISPRVPIIARLARSISKS